MNTFEKIWGIFLLVIVIAVVILGIFKIKDMSREAGRRAGLETVAVKSSTTVINIDKIGKAKLTRCDTTIYIRDGSKSMNIEYYYDLE